MKGISINEQVKTDSDVFCVKDNWEIIRGRMKGNVGCRRLNDGAPHRTADIDGYTHCGLVIADTPENYEHLVGIFGEGRVPKPDITTTTSLAYLRKHGKAIGKVSDKSVEHARASNEFHIVDIGSDDETFFVGNKAWSYCVLYNSILQEVKPEPKRPALKAGDYVINVMGSKHKVYHDGNDLVVFDADETELLILEQIEMGHFERLDGE